MTLERSSLSLWFGIAIYRLRQLRNLTQNQLAIEAGISQAYISKIENGKSHFRIHLHVLEAIAQALGVSLSSLFEQAERRDGDQLKVKFMLEDRSGS